MGVSPNPKHLASGKYSPVEICRCICAPYRSLRGNGLRCGNDLRLEASHCPIMTSLWVDEELDSSVYLDSTVTVADATHVRYALAALHEYSPFNSSAQRSSRYGG
eukprot:4358576-Pyramimonas_sp.AAC.1